MSACCCSHGKTQYGRETYVIASTLLFLVQLAIVLVDAGPVAVGVAAEGDVETLEEAVAAREQGLRSVCARVDRGEAVEDDDPVSEVSRHDEVVLDDESCLLRVHYEALDHAGGDDTLLRVKVAVTC